jgi:hypothetical protein
MAMQAWCDWWGCWFEVRLYCEEGAGEGARQLARAARLEGHQARLGLDDVGVEVALVLIRGANPSQELERLMNKCGLSGCYSSLRA